MGGGSRAKSSERGADNGTEVGGSKRDGEAGASVWSGLNWGMMATWMSLLSTIIFNIQFQFIYRNMQQGRGLSTGAGREDCRRIIGHMHLLREEDPHEY